LVVLLVAQDKDWPPRQEYDHERVLVFHKKTYAGVPQSISPVLNPNENLKRKPKK
jgi:hypothetical protein